MDLTPIRHTEYFKCVEMEIDFTEQSRIVSIKIPVSNATCYTDFCGALKSHIVC